MTTETKLKKIVHFDIRNKTDIKVLNSVYLVYENQDFYKNGKPKGQAYKTNEYYFFDNQADYDNLLDKYRTTPQALSQIVMVVDEGLKYNKQFLINNLNKN